MQSIKLYSRKFAASMNEACSLQYMVQYEVLGNDPTDRLMIT